VCFKPLHSGAFLLTSSGANFSLLADSCFKPLHSGAFLLTTRTNHYRWLSLQCFKPLHSRAFLLTGRWRDGCGHRRGVSNPFIAGHSFLQEATATPTPMTTGFKPLHSGAFLLTFIRREALGISNMRFKPLHSGAFLLTYRWLSLQSHKVQVSNPFIAGHSFLLPYAPRGAIPLFWFQTPS